MRILQLGRVQTTNMFGERAFRAVIQIQKGKSGAKGGGRRNTGERLLIL